jgi:long-subunit acyl-CoA synthetase (AMP-forming)
LTYQLQLANVNFVIVHSTVLLAALEATQAVGLPSNKVIVLDEAPLPVGLPRMKNVLEFIAQGKKKTAAFYERRLKHGEGKTKIALLCWSSGTTGKSKVAVSTSLAKHHNLPIVTGSGNTTSCINCEYHSDGCP